MVNLSIQFANAMEKRIKAIYAVTNKKGGERSVIATLTENKRDIEIKPTTDGWEMNVSSMEDALAVIPLADLSNDWMHYKTNKFPEMAFALAD